MQLEVLHDTEYHYLPAVRTAQHLAHLCPRDTPFQTRLAHTLQIEPLPARQLVSTDSFGNSRCHVEVDTPHDRLLVRARSLVSTAKRPAVATSLAWEDVRERMRYHRLSRFDAASEFLFSSPYVPRHDDLLAYARTSFTARRPLHQAALDLMERIHREFEYAPQTTDASTPALDALAQRRGVCQDFAHVMIGAMRSLGLSARYVSGYLLTEPAPGEPRLIGADASHAWVSVYLPPKDVGAKGHWWDLDPTNQRPVGEDYVTLAYGRDFSDLSPLRGVIQGGGSQHHLSVAVTVREIDAID